MQAIAQLPSVSQKLTVSKLLPGKHIACQLTKGGEKKKPSQIVEHSLFWCSCHQTQKPNEKYMITITWEGGSMGRKRNLRRTPTFPT